MNKELLQLGKKKFHSRLFVGTGRFESLDIMQKSHAAAETEMVTVAIRRYQISSGHDKSIIDYIDQKKITIMANTSGIQTAEEAKNIAIIANSMGIEYLKIEIVNETKTLLPDPIETNKAVAMIREVFPTDTMFLMVYTNDDPILAKRLVEQGADCIMPTGSPIGSGRGILNPSNLILMKKILRNSVPMVLDAGIGAPSDVCLAMELGFDAVLLNTAIAKATHPIQMAVAMKNAVMAGRMGYLSGIIPKKMYASASSEGVF